MPTTIVESESVADDAELRALAVAHVSNLDTPPMTRAEAEDLTRAVRALLTDIDQRIEIGLAGGLNPLTLIGALTATLTELERLHPGENVVRLRELFEPRIDALMAVAS